MNYRHVYHAGNFADVVKHLVLTLVIAHLKRKPAPFRVIDTHAGAGLYDLDSPAAQRTGEWREGIGRLLEASGGRQLDEVFAPLLAVVQRFNGGQMQTGSQVKCYPGSPLIASELLRPHDTLIANELHPEDRNTLEGVLSPYKNAKTMGVDGYVALKATLPPKERRGVVLIDPPFEEPGELGRLVNGLRQGIRRFATGTFLLWYPIKDPRPVAEFKQELAALELDKLLAIEFYVRAPRDIDRLNGHGLVVLNPPFTLRDDLERVSAFLVEVLGQADGARFEIQPLCRQD